MRWTWVKAPDHFEVQKPQFSEAFPEAAIREGADELTLRADEVGTQWAFINTNHIEFERWRPPLVDADWHAFCQAICKGIEGEEWEDCAVTAERGARSQEPRSRVKVKRAKALWAIKAAWDRGEDY